MRLRRSRSLLVGLAIVAVACRFDSGRFDDRRCLVSTECRPDHACVAGFCAQATCDTELDCAAGAVCGYQFLCEDAHCVATTCSVDTDCSPPRTCTDGICSSVCTAFESRSGTQEEATGSYNAVVVVSPPSVQNIRFSIAATDGTAVATRDYAVLPGPYTIPAGATSTRVEVTLIDNLYAEPSKTFTLTLVDPRPGSLGMPSSHVVTIEDADVLALAASFDPAQSDRLEFEGTGGPNRSYDYAVVLNVAADSIVTVVVGVGGTATVGGGNSDGSIAGIPVTFAPGETTRNITVSIVPDTDGEPDEAIVLTLTSAIGAAIGSPATRTHTILNDD